MAEVMVIMGSASDLDLVKPALKLLAELKIDALATIASAHRTPERLEGILRDHPEAKVFICAAGMAAHLAGAVAARTVCPVIGLPLASGSLSGLDALFSTVQMPSGYPVATVALNGAKNAAWLAAQILALGDAQLKDRIALARDWMAEETAKAARRLEQGD